MKRLHLRLTITSVAVLSVLAFTAGATVSVVQHYATDAPATVSVKPVNTVKSAPKSTAQIKPTPSATTAPTASQPISSTIANTSTAAVPATSKITPVAATPDNGPYGPRCLVIQNREYVASNARVPVLFAEHNANLATLKQAYDSGEYNTDYLPDYASPFDEYQADIAAENQRWSDATYASSQQIAIAMHAAGCAY